MGRLEAIYHKGPIVLQTILLNAKALELYLERYGRKFWMLYEEFDRNQWLSRTELEAYQDERLRILIEHAYRNVPYYNELMNTLKLLPSDFKTSADLYKIPILRKEDIRKHSARLTSRRYPKLLLRHGHTSGTTGSPLDFYYDIRTCVVHHAADWRQKYWAGLEFGQSYASLLGRVIVPISQQRPPFWRQNYLNRQLFLSSFHLKDTNMPFYFEKLDASKIRFIEGYPSTMYIMALYLLKNSQTFPMRAVLTTSETLFDYQREAIEAAFACKIFDHYGMAERVVFAAECDRHGGHHLNSDYGITEFLDAKNEPVGAGRVGKIVATSLHNFAMPFIRYETNDASVLSGTSCSCGRGFPMMESVATKCESIVTLPDGRLISPSVLTHPFKPMYCIKESQILQERSDELIVRIVRNDGYTDRDEKTLVSAFRERLGDEISIKVRYVDAIERTANAKFKWVVSKIPPQF